MNNSHSRIGNKRDFFRKFTGNIYYRANTANDLRRFYFRAINVQAKCHLSLGGVRLKLWAKKVLALQMLPRRSVQIETIKNLRELYRDKHPRVSQQPFSFLRKSIQI